MKKTGLDSSEYEESDSFLRLGGHPVLDFCNTIVFHGDKLEDRLPTRREMEHFLGDTYNEKLHIGVDQFVSLINFRELLRELFEALAEGESAEKISAPLNEWLKEVNLRLELQAQTAENRVFANYVSQKKERCAASKLVVSLFNFLNGLRNERLKKCANPSCSHFFYDTSKNNTRNWCSMKSCGNIMKARAFYKRSKAQ